MFLHCPAGHSSLLTQRVQQRWDRWTEVGMMENEMGQTGRVPRAQAGSTHRGFQAAHRNGASGFVGSSDTVATAPSFVQKSSLQRAGLPARG